MKIWSSFGSEHSMNLIMIGHFKRVEDAEKAKEIIELLTEQVMADNDSVPQKSGDAADRYTDGMRALLEKTNFYTINPAEFEQFGYDVRVEAKGERLILSTDESEVSGFMKVLLHKGARVELYSAHDYPDAEKEEDKC